MGEKPTEVDETTARQADNFLKINGDPATRVQAPEQSASDVFIKLQREGDPGSAPGIAVSDPGAPGSKK